MVIRSAIVRGLVVLLLLLVGSLPARAQPTSDDEPTPADPKMAEAKETFRKGVELFDAGDVERALELFERSRALFPSIQNTSNAAICLDRLGRYDDALELYELVLTEFKADLTDRERESLGPTMAKLRERVGSLWVSANTAGALVIDGRARANVPLTIAVRLLPGERVVRVMADGYATFERRVNIEATKTARIEARLEPLRDAGLLRIEDDGASGSTVFVDGAKMGTSPWEGTLGPGRHVVWSELGDMGSAPKNVVVVQGQKAVVELTSKPLGAMQELEVKPATAEISLDTVSLGRGSWRGRLPRGSYVVRAFEEGYHPKETRLVVADPTPGGGVAVPLTLELAVDEAHPRWPKGEVGALVLGASVGYTLGASFESGAESNCRECPGAPLVHGVTAALSGGYRFGVGVSIELAIGYQRFYSSFDRIVDAGVATPYPDLGYSLHDVLRIDGPFAGIALGYRLPFAERFAFNSRVMGAAMLSSARDDISAQASTGGQSANVVVRDADPLAQVGTVFVEGEVGLSVVAGSFDIGLALAAMVFVLDGPTLDQRRLDVPYACDPKGPGGVGCIQSGIPLADEAAHSTFVLGSPQLRLGYSF